MRWACRFCPRCHRPQRHTWLGVQRTWLTPRSSLTWRRSKCTKSRKSILAVFWVLKWTSGVNFRLPVHTWRPLLFVPEWPFFAIAAIQPWRGSDLRKSKFCTQIGKRNFLTYTTYTSLPWLLPPTAEFCRRTGRVRVGAAPTTPAAKCSNALKPRRSFIGAPASPIPRPLVKLYANN